jgi:fructose-1,6-bisphosphatase I/sedoheptulose-1,7-bisphosphatase
VDECLAGKTGPRGKDFNTRWIASMVAEAHRILMRGGVFMYPRDTKDPASPAACACCTKPTPSASSSNRPAAAPAPGARPCWACKPSELHQRIGLVFGSKNEVERIERYHQNRPRGRQRQPAVYRAQPVPRLIQRRYCRLGVAIKMPQQAFIFSKIFYFQKAPHV